MTDMPNLSTIFAVGWNAQEQIHNAARVQNEVLGDAYGYLMQGGDIQTRRFAATVLDAIGFTGGAIGNRESRKGKVSISSRMEARDIDYIHRKFGREIYLHHLAKPFMSDDELADYLFRETLDACDKHEYLDLLSKDIHESIDIRL